MLWTSSKANNFFISAPPAEEPAVEEVTEKMDELKVEEDKKEESESTETEEKTDTDKDKTTEE